MLGIPTFTFFPFPSGLFSPSFPAIKTSSLAKSLVYLPTYIYQANVAILHVSRTSCLKPNMLNKATIKNNNNNYIIHCTQHRTKYSGCSIILTKRCSKNITDIIKLWKQSKYPTVEKPLKSPQYEEILHSYKRFQRTL